MLLLNQNNLGEQALNKIAELALVSQFNQARQLRVKVKTDPTLLSQGKLESLLIDGEGVVSHKNLRMEQMRLQMGEIAVSPFKALLGNIELTQPTQGRACVVLTETDFNRAFNTKGLSDRFIPLKMTLDAVHCYLLASGQILIEIEVRSLVDQTSSALTLVATPKIDHKTGNVNFTEIAYTQGQEPSAAFTRILQEKAEEVLSLRNFEMRGISLNVQQLEIRTGEMTLRAIANMTHFPK